MELYILSKNDLSILSICKVVDYEINLDEETNAKSIFKVIKADGLEEGNFVILNGLYKQFLFVIPKDGVQSEKDNNLVTITALDISNIFDRKVIEKNIGTMTSNSIEKFIADTIAENFVNSDDTFLNIGYIDIYWHTNTQANVSTNSEDGLYNFHTFLINCRQYKNIYTDFQFVNGKLRIDIENKQESVEMIDTTLPEVTDYHKVREEKVTAKVQVYIRENGSEYNLYLKTDRTTTTNKNDPNRASGKIEVISVDTADKAPEEALNVIKGNSYKHLVEFKIAKTSKLMDITKLNIGRPVRIKTNDEIYDSYISAITLTDENFVYFKSGSLRVTLLDKLKMNKDSGGNKLDKTGGEIHGDLAIHGNFQVQGKISLPIGSMIITKDSTGPASYMEGTWELNNKVFTPLATSASDIFQRDTTNTSSGSAYMSRNGQSINIHISVKTSVALGESSVTLGTVNFPYIGISRTLSSIYTVATSDTGNGLAMITMDYQSGDINCTDVVTKTSGGTIASGSTVTMDFVMVFPKGYMLNAKCDQYIWERTA